MISAAIGSAGEVPPAPRSTGNATHSPIIMAYPHGRLLELGGDGIRQAAYEETEHFRVTRDFLVRRERILKQLLTAGDGQAE